jgi:hypothetical protein
MDYAKNYGLKKHIYENKKSGILTHNEMDSALVGLNILELKFVF